MPFPILGWHSGISTPAILAVRTRPSLVYDRLFAALGEFANSIIMLLTAIAVFFALIEAAAYHRRLTRTVTRSVAALYTATEHINRGDLEHRIQVTSNDQLAALDTRSIP